MIIAILGIGEAGGEIASALQAKGVDVRGYDTIAVRCLNAETPADAVADAQLVISLTTAAEALTAARSVIDVLSPGQVYADANTSSAALKRELDKIIGPTGAKFADVALMAPVPGAGLSIPALVSGGGAATTAEILGSCGMPITMLDGEPGVAASRKLLRSVAWKGMAAVVNEALAAADAADLGSWMRTELLTMVAAIDEDRLARITEGSRLHAVRRSHEMAEVVAYLDELGVAADVSEAARTQLEELAQR